MSFDGSPEKRTRRFIIYRVLFSFEYNFINVYCFDYNFFYYIIYIFFSITTVKSLNNVYRKQIRVR